ncbi:hypothetical protein DFH06DRAFT_1300865 [Mycena polygramma]|nr:hypothetical protein DFH06DRAFT_1300865 [Mycena polygramma]
MSKLDNPVRPAWGQLQSTQSVRLQLGLRADDTIVEALFAQRNAKGRHHGRQCYTPSRMSTSPSQMSTHRADHDSFQLSFNEAKTNWFRPGQTALSAQQDISTFVEAQEKWVKTHVGPNTVHAEAAKWVVGSYAALFASWSVVSMRMIPIGGVGSRQFAVKAEDDIPPHTMLHELTGLLSSDPADGRSHSNLSVMWDLDGVQRVVFGPIRLINHSCDPNAWFQFVKQGNGHAVTVCTNDKSIQKGEEITIDYGRGYWTEDNPCLCSICVPRDPNTVQRRTVTMGMSHAIPEIEVCATTPTTP